MQRVKATYIIYYTDKDDISEGFTAYGSDNLKEAIKWLHSLEVKASRIAIYKRGKDFDNNHDDVIEAWMQYWK